MLIEAFSARVKSAPNSHLQFLNTRSDFADSFFSIVLVGRRESEKIKQTKEFFRKNYMPNRILIFKPGPGSKSEKREEAEIVKVCNYIDDFTMKEEETTIYVCSNLNCELPTTDIEEMKEMLP